MQFPAFQFVPIESFHWTPLNLVLSLSLPPYSSPQPSEVLSGRIPNLTKQLVAGH